MVLRLQTNHRSQSKVKSMCHGMSELLPSTADGIENTDKVHGNEERCEINVVKG